MTFEDQIRRERPTMSKSFAKLADFLVDSYTEASFMTASELAHLLNLDAATVVRFAQALGYKGFPQLQQEIRQKVKNDLLIRPRQAEVSQSIPGIAASSLRDLAKDLEQTRITLDTLALEQLVEQLGTSRRILLIADPPAQPAAQTLAYALRQAGFLVDEASPLPIDLARLLYTASTADLLLALEVQGETPSIANALIDARSRWHSHCSPRQYGLAACCPSCGSGFGGAYPSIRLCRCFPGANPGVCPPGNTAQQICPPLHRGRTGFQAIPQPVPGAYPLKNTY